MDYKEMKKIISDMENSKLDSLEIEFADGVKIKMTKSTNNNTCEKVNNSNMIEAVAPIAVPAIQKNTENSLINVPQEVYKEIKSPMVGTFYSSSSPKAKPFVNVGDKIVKGQVVCVIEAMKLMNEIESEYDGEVVEICVKDEDMVEFGTTLIKLK